MNPSEVAVGGGRAEGRRGFPFDDPRRELEGDEKKLICFLVSEPGDVPHVFIGSGCTHGLGIRVMGWEYGDSTGR